MKNNNDIIISKGNKYSKVIDLLYSAKQSGVDIILNKDQLQLKLHEDKTFDEKLLLEIRNHKQLIIEFLSRKNLKSEKIDNSYNKIRPFDRNKIKNIPLSFSQERLWFIDQMEGSVQYHIPDIIRLKGKLNQDALEFALQTIVNRHEVLRTVIRDLDGEGYQFIKPESNWHLEIIGGQQYLKDPEGLQKYIRKLINQPFDLSQDDLIRGHLINLDEEEHILLVTLHHIASDGWSKSILVKEVAELYRSYVSGKPAQLSKIDIQYSDFSLWQRSYLQGEMLEKKIGYWREKLGNVSTLQLPTDYARPVVQSSKGATYPIRIEKKLSEELNKLTKQSGATLFMTMLSALKVLLSRYSGQEDICVGTPVAGRQQPEVENLIGFFINTLALRSEVKGDQSFQELLQQVKATTMDAYDHQDLPFEKVVEAVVKERDLSRTPLFQVMLVLQNTPEVPKLQVGELTLIRQSSEHATAKFDLNITLNETANGISGSLTYSTDLYNQGTIERMVGHYQELLHSIVSNPAEKVSKLKMLTSKEEEQLTKEFNDTKAAYRKDKTVTQLIEEQAKKTPGKTAVVYEDKGLTYQELNERSNQLARYLRKKGVGAETLVPVCVERSIEMLTAILGILKSGGAYVPIDPEYPADRIGYMLEDTGARIIVSSKASKEKLPKQEGAEIISIDTDWEEINKESKENLEIEIALASLAYIIYTSGSTGKPKGVMIEHGSLLNYILNSQAHYITEDEDSTGSYIHLSYTFDASVTGMFMPLIAGKPVVIASTKTMNVFEDENLQKYAPFDFIKLTPSHLELITEIETKDKAWFTKKLVIGGEALHASHFNYFKEKGIEAEIINEYGPTETTVGCSTYQFSTFDNQETGSISIGKPMDNTKMYITSPGGELLPAGVWGEIWIGGEGVARGYLNREELTHEKFIQDPFTKEGNQKLYKTGDIGRWQADGTIEYRGRKDDQVKIRGYRIELGEIENVLLQNEKIRQAVVLAKTNKAGNKYLAGYVTPEEKFDKEAITGWLGSKLPEYMVPTLWIEVAEMPLTSNGKIDRRALPEADPSELISNEYVAPRNETEERLTKIWQQLLGVERVGIHDNFFELGGHSLLVMRLIWGIRKELSEEVAVKEIFIHPTIASLSTYLESRIGGHIVQQIERQPRQGKIPLSFSQERLWFIDQMEGSVQYHINAVLRLNGTLNQDALEKSLQYIVNRHEVLRTVFLEEDGHAYQQIKEKDLWQLDIVDGAKYKESNAALQQYTQQLVKKPFNLSKDFMLRATLLPVSEDEHLLVVTMHHIASDGWSMGIMVKEVASAYNSISGGRSIELSPLKIQYADYSIWQRNYLQGDLLENKLSYWKNKLKGIANLELPTDYQRPSVLNTKGAVKKFTLDKTFSEGLYSLSQDQGATLFMTLLAGFKVLLHRYSGQEDICVGSPIANRTQQEVEGLIGFFVNTLSLRSEVNGTLSFKDFLQQIKATTLEGYEHQDIPFEKIVEVVVKERDLSRTPLFQVMFVLQTTAENTDVRLGNLKLSREVSLSNTSKFEITFSISENENGLQVSIEYNTNLYKEETIDRMMSHYKELLGSIIKNPEEKISKLRMLTSLEERQLLFEFNDSAVGYPHDKNIVGLFEAQVQKTPDNIAVVFEESSITYAELNKRSNQLAHLLGAKGVKEDALVPICIERSIDMIIGLLAILKAGGAYVPIDPEYPEDRINYMLENAGSRLVVTSLLGKTKLHLTDDFGMIEMNGKDLSAIRAESEEALKIKIKPSSIAYVIHTSGSTGKPKGVMIEHRNVVRLFETDKPLYDFNESDVWTMFHSFCFDFSVWEMYGALFYGGRVVIVPPTATKDTVLFADLLLKERVTILNQTPSSFYVLQDILVTRTNHIDIRYVIFGGEALSPAKLKPWKQLYKNCRIINMYGITETTVHVTYQEIGWQQIENGNSIIGKTIPTLYAYILDSNQNLLPIGVAGELCIGGEGLARGYLNREDLTAQKFIKNPFINDPEARIYKSGDLGRWMPDGTIEYLGRLDDQVKIRGYRIELGEIETVALQSGLIKQAVVLARSNSGEGKRLVGYTVADGKLDKPLLTSYLHTKLPDYMVPQVWVQLDYLPLTSNGKIDKKALPDPGLTEFATNEYVAPRNELESGLADIWKELLQVDRVGIHDNFFELGGHSLLVIILVSAIRKRLKIELTINEIFINPTIADFADNFIEKIKNPSLQALNIKYLVPLKTGGNKVPLYIVCGEGGTALRFKNFAELLAPDQPVYALQLPVDARDLKNIPDNIEEIAKLFIDEIIINNPEGPYALAGHCLGGFIAFEIARQLRKGGKNVQLLSMFDTVIRKSAKRKAPSWKNLYLIPLKIKMATLKILFKINFESFLFRKHTKHAIGYKLNSLKFLVYRIKNRKKLKSGDLEYIGLDAFKKQFAYSDASKNYKLSPYDGEIVLFYAKERYYFMDVNKKVTFKRLYLNDETKNMWSKYAKDITIHEIEGEHSTMFETECAHEFANLLQGYLNPIGD